MSTVETWRNNAACLSEEHELFFPIGTSRSAIDQTAAAKRVCDRCSVQATCLAWALETHQDHGIWGGLSEEERRSLSRRLARTRVQTRPRVLAETG